MGFEDFLRFFFRREADLFNSDDEEPSLDADPSLVAIYYQELFSNPGILRGYSREDVDHGFAAMINPNIPISLQTVIWNPGIPFEARAAVVRAMLFLYRDLFGPDPLFGTPFTWWDPIAYDFESGNRRREDSAETRRMQDCMFSTLTEILNLPSIGAQKAALHGLGHLHHPQTQEVIDDYIGSHPDLPVDVRQYALQSAAGTIQQGAPPLRGQRKLLAKGAQRMTPLGKL